MEFFNSQRAQLESEQGNSRISTMNFGGRLLMPEDKQFQMNGSWVPVTPEKPLLVRNHTISAEWQGNQMGKASLQEFAIPGNGSMKEMLHYNVPDQNLHLLGQAGQTRGYKPVDGASAERNRIVNRTAGSYTQALHYDSNGLNINSLEFLLMKSATNVVSANGNLDISISQAARQPLEPKCHTQAGIDQKDSCADGFMLNQSKNYSSIDKVYENANRLLIQNRNSECHGSYSDNLHNNVTHSSVSNTLKSSFTEIPHDNWLCTLPKYSVTECSVQEKDKKGKSLKSTETEIQKDYDGLLQHIVDSSSAAISIPYWEQKGSESNDFGREICLDFDLIKTPGQKPPKRRKHRPKVIVEGKPGRTPNPATQKKTASDENPPKKRKYVRRNAPKAAATPQADVTRETLDSNPAARKSCKKALNFDVENSRYESQSKVVDEQEIQHRNEKAFNITSEYESTELLGEVDMMYGTDSALLISVQDGLPLLNQQPRDTDGITLSLNQKLSDTNLPVRQAAVALSANAEQVVENLPVTEKGLSQGNAGLCQERKNRCMQQYIQAEEVGNVLFQSETYLKNLQKTEGLMSQNSLQAVPNMLSNSMKGGGFKRKHCPTIENPYVSATNQLDSSLLCQGIFQADENCNGATIDLETQKKEAKKRFPTKVYGSSSFQINTEDGSKRVGTRGRKASQSQLKDKVPNHHIDSAECEDKKNTIVIKPTGDGSTSSGAPQQIYSIPIDEIICKLKNLSIMESKISEMNGQNALVPYQGHGSVVPYEKNKFAKKHKARPKVDLDPETERTWKLLMGKEGSEDLEGNDKEKEKWWEEERKVFHGRADSFIARMHLVQGDRHFSQWKGSVVDSVIGVFLTQNVSDHFSSSAFMSLAARFPLKSTNKRPYSIVSTNILVQEPEVCIVNTDNTITSHGRLIQPTYHQGFVKSHDTREIWRDTETSGINITLTKPNDQSAEEEIISSQDSLNSSITQGTSRGPASGCEPRETQFSTSTNTVQVGKTTLFEEFYYSVTGVSLFHERTKYGQAQQTEQAKQKSGPRKKNNLNIHSAFSHVKDFGMPLKQVPVVPSTDHQLNDSEAQGLNAFQMHGGDSSWPETVSILNKLQDTSYKRFGIREVGGNLDSSTEQQFGPLGSKELPTVNPYGPLSNHLLYPHDLSQLRSRKDCNKPSLNHNLVGKKTLQPEAVPFIESISTSQKLDRSKDGAVNGSTIIARHTDEGFDAENRISSVNRQAFSDNRRAEPEPQEQVYSSGSTYKESKLKVSKAKKIKPKTEMKNVVDWDNLRKQAQEKGVKKERSKDTMDSLDYEAVRCASVKEISEAIKERGMSKILAERIKEFLNRLDREHGSIDLEWLRDIPADKAKDYLLSIGGLGLKSVECVRLLTLHHHAFPVDTNVGRIAVRLGWVPLQPLPEKLQIHNLELYPVLESIQKYLWPRLCKLDQRTLYELHYQMITFGKVFCTKKKPNCNACPMRAECRHFASAFASARLALPGPEEKGIVSTSVPIVAERNPAVSMNTVLLPLPENNLLKEVSYEIGNCEPIIEVPETPEQECIEALESDIEDAFSKDLDEIPNINYDMENFVMNVQEHMPINMQYHEGDMSKAIIALSPDAASIPTPKLKHVSQLRTEHQVYELPDSHPLLEKMDKREPDDPSPYLLAIWTPGETANSIEPPERRCESQDSTSLCNDKVCFSCNSIREANLQTVRGTILIPCRTATRGSFPLNGTYFQVNEVFADHASSIKPLDVPRAWIWNLRRRTVYFGTSVSTIFKGLSTQGIQQCFWRGFVCVRGFDQQTRAPRPLQQRLHLPASKIAKAKN